MKISQQSVQPDDIAGISVMVSEIMVLRETNKPFDTPFPSSYRSTGRVRLFLSQNDCLVSTERL